MPCEFQAMNCTTAADDVEKIKVDITVGPENNSPCKLFLSASNVGQMLASMHAKSFSHKWMIVKANAWCKHVVPSVDAAERTVFAERLQPALEIFHRRGSDDFRREPSVN